jgi:hypothetical protein
MIVNDKIESMWKKPIVAYFKALQHHFLGGTKENDEKPQSG